VRILLEREGFVRGRRPWRQAEFCLSCWEVVDVESGKRVRVELDGLQYVSTRWCDRCAAVLVARGFVDVSFNGKTLRVYTHLPPGRWRVRGDGALLCRGVWL